MHNFQVDWLGKWAKYTPDKFFLREYNSGRAWTYGEFNNAANSLARHFINDLKLRKGERVVVYSTNNAEYVLIFAACIKAGLVMVPLNFRLTPIELNQLIVDAEPSVFVFENTFEEQVSKLTELKESVVKLSISDIKSYFNFSRTQTEDIDTSRISKDDYVMILYTSGTTGVPKGAIITHKMLFWNAVNTQLRLNLTSEDHTQGYAPFFHTGGWNVLFTPFLHVGASHTLITKFDPELILKLMEEERSTILFGVPTMLQMISDSPNYENADLSSVRYAIVGGAPMPIPLIEKWHKKGIFIRQGYGLTEAGPNIFSLNHEDAIRKQGSIGFPNFYIETKLMKESMEECKAGEIGELWIKSPVVTCGYWKNEKATKETIIDEWLRTGDIMKFDEEGYYYVVDRKKNMFISGGENVYPAEVERVILQYPVIKQAAVIGVPDSKWGEVGKAFLVLKENETFDEANFFEYCKEHLAKYKIPKHIKILDELPLNDSGKIDRIKLKSVT